MRVAPADAGQQAVGRGGQARALLAAAQIAPLHGRLAIEREPLRHLRGMLLEGLKVRFTVTSTRAHDIQRHQVPLPLVGNHIKECQMAGSPLARTGHQRRASKLAGQAAWRCVPQSLHSS